MSLPLGEEDERGKLSVDSIVITLARAVHGAFDGGSISSKPAQARQLRGYADDIAKYCDPARNPTAFRACQAAAAPAARPLLLIVRDAWPQHELKKDTLTELRVACLEALARICFGHVSSAAAVASVDLLEPAVVSALRPVYQVQHQQEHLAALQLVQAISAAVTEAPVISKLLPAVVGVLANSYCDIETDGEGYPAFRAVRQTAVEVLVSCSLGRRQREAVASLLPEATCRAILADASDEGAGIWDYSTALLFANLCDLPVPGADDTSILFGSLAQPLWARTAFADGLAASLTAALRVEQWPARSGIYHTPWKLLNTCLRLAVAGYFDQLRGVASLLVQCVQRVVPEAGENIVSADDARTARLAVEVLFWHARGEEVVLAALREEPPSFCHALQEMRGELPAAEELIKLLEGFPVGVDSTTLTVSPFS